jgi:hypothetical protein
MTVLTLNTFCNSISIITNCMYAAMSKSNVWLITQNSDTQWHILMHSMYDVKVLFHSMTGRSHFMAGLHC